MWQQDSQKFRLEIQIESRKHVHVMYIGSITISITNERLKFLSQQPCGPWMPLPSILWRNLLSNAIRGRLSSALRYTTQAAPLLTNISREQPRNNSLHPYEAHMNTPERFGNFDLVRQFKLDFTDVTVSKWRSRN